MKTCLALLVGLACATRASATPQSSIHLRIHEHGKSAMDGTCTIESESQPELEHEYLLQGLQLRVPLGRQGPERQAMPEEEHGATSFK